MLTMPDPIPLRILHEDDDLVVISKPAGLAVHRSGPSAPGEQFILQLASAQTGRYLHPAHRLDRNTSGILCFATTAAMSRAMQERLRADDTTKTYLVLARGETPERFESDRPLRTDRGEPRPARTSFTRLATGSRCSLLETRIFTGRHHQIRRHLNHLAHHVIGDTTHGKGRINAFFRAEYDLPRMFIHAWRLVIRHPHRDETLVLHDPLAPDLRAFLLRLPDFDPAFIATL
ncbi:MAG: hypothetical protein KDA25_00065 [Phycisphaerales bacterium]|nr:hypothetical protein [Phycisphaerales bacterium]